MFAQDSNTYGRKALPGEGPAGDLGCDKLFQMEIERLCQVKSDSRMDSNLGLEPTVLDRQNLEDKFLDFLLNFPESGGTLFIFLLLFLLLLTVRHIECLGGYWTACRSIQKCNYPTWP